MLLFTRQKKKKKKAENVNVDTHGSRLHLDWAKKPSVCVWFFFFFFLVRVCKTCNYCLCTVYKQ